MGRKRDEPSKKEEDAELNYSEESLSDSDEEITFDALTTEERKKQEEKLRQLDDDEEGTEESDSEEDDDNGIINVDFEFSDPKEEHFKSIRNFMRYLLLGAAKDLDFSPLADAVVSQVEAGSVVQVSGDEDADAYAYLTMLNLQTYKDNTTLQSILSILRKNCPAELRKQFDSYLEKSTGILLNERMRNFPPEVIPPLFNSLQEDIKWALENSDNKEAFKYQYMLIVAPCFREIKPTRSKDGSKVQVNEDNAFSYFHFEDDLMKKHSELSFSFIVPQLGDESLSEVLQQSREVMIVPFSTLSEISKEIAALVSAFCV